MRRYALRDDQWDQIKDFLSGHEVSLRGGRGSFGAVSLARRFARPLLGERCELFGVRFGFDGVGIEGAADPFGQLGVAFVLQIGDRLEEVGVSPRPAAILGRAAPDRLDQARVLNARLGVEDTLDLDRVFPAVAEVVEM